MLRIKYNILYKESSQSNKWASGNISGWLKHQIPSPVFISFLLMLGIGNNIVAQKNTQVLNWLSHTDSENALYNHLVGQAYKLLDKREEYISNLKTIEDWQERQRQVKETIWDIVGRFSEKTPLNARITSKISKDGYSIENLIYESLPGYYVTASLFIPDKRQSPAPAILFCSGHSPQAYRRDLYQLPLLNLVRKGFIVLAIDPVGQGERLQYFDPVTGKSIIGGSTSEHSYPSVQTALIGHSVARYFIWDGIRGIDYLVSRKEVDPKRIGVHGLSGGGTQTAYISALDSRVVASAPACYITSYRRLMESIGVQDGEQNFYHGLLKGIDHADLIEVRAPKPTLIIATTNDFFSIQGVYETYAEIKQLYSLYKKADNIGLAVDDYTHGYTRKNREAMYAFFQEHLDNPGSASEEKVIYLTQEELQVTSTGQLSTSLKGETIYSMNEKQTLKIVGSLENSRTTSTFNTQEIIGSAKQLSGYREPTKSDHPVFTGSLKMPGYVVEKYFIKGEGEYSIPYLKYVPHRSNGKGIVILHPEGKSKVDIVDLDTLINEGFTILVPDLIGIGELGGGVLKGDAYIDDVSYNVWFTAMLIGRSITGIRASDIVKLSHLLKQDQSVERVFGIATAQTTSALLHAAAFDSVISRVILIKPYLNYIGFVQNQFYNPQFVFSMVPGALTGYDLPDLAATLVPRKLIVFGAVDSEGKSIGTKEFEKSWQIVRTVYRKSNNINHVEFHSLNNNSNDNMNEIMVEKLSN